MGRPSRRSRRVELARGAKFRTVPDLVKTELGGDDGERRKMRLCHGDKLRKSEEHVLDQTLEEDGVAVSVPIWMIQEPGENWWWCASIGTRIACSRGRSRRRRSSEVGTMKQIKGTPFSHLRKTLSASIREASMQVRRRRWCCSPWGGCRRGGSGGDGRKRRRRRGGRG
jgi:hypothetical protein